MISDYFPKNKLAMALSTYSMGVFLGMGLSIVIGAGLISTLPTEGMVRVPVFYQYHRYGIRAALSSVFHGFHFLRLNDDQILADCAVHHRWDCDDFVFLDGVE